MVLQPHPTLHSVIYPMVVADLDLFWCEHHVSQNSFCQNELQIESTASGDVSKAEECHCPPMRIVSNQMSCILALQLVPQ